MPLRTYASQQGLDASETVLDTDLAKTVMEQFGKTVKRCKVTRVLGIELLDGAEPGSENGEGNAKSVRLAKNRP